MNKLAGQSSKYFRPHVRHVRTMPETLPQNLEPKRLADQVREEAERTIQAYEALEG